MLVDHVMNVNRRDHRKKMFLNIFFWLKYLKKTSINKKNHLRPYKNVCKTNTLPLVDLTNLLYNWPIVLTRRIMFGYCIRKARLCRWVLCECIYIHTYICECECLCVCVFFVCVCVFCVCFCLYVFVYVCDICLFG